MRTWVFAIITAVTLSLVAPAAAQFVPPVQTQTAVDPSNRDQSDQAFSIQGRIKSVDYTANTIVVQSKKNTATVVLTPTTSVDLAGQQGGISDLRPGMHVRVRGSVRDGVMTAESIVVR